MKKIEIFPSTINPADASPFFNNIIAPVLRLISLKDKKQEPSFLFSLSNAYVSPYGVVFKDGKVIKESIYKYTAKKKRDNFLSFCNKILKRKVRKIEGDCVVINHSWYQNYYHWMIEMIPRLFLLRDQLVDKKLVIHKSLSDFHFQTLCKFNFKEIVFIEDDEILKCEKINFTSFPNYYINQSLTIGSQKLNIIELNINYAIMREMKQWMVNNNPLFKDGLASIKSKIYISRKKAGHRKILNESALDLLLNNRDFTKVYFEDISLDTQIYLMNNSDIVISIHGAGLTNILFMRPDTHIINLISEHHHEFCYLSIASVAGINYTHINCEGAMKVNPAYNDITVDLNAVESILDSISEQVPKL